MVLIFINNSINYKFKKFIFNAYLFAVNPINIALY